MLEIQNVSKTFNAGTVNQKTALNGLNLKLNEGDFVTVIGGNGAGKSTMMQVLDGKRRPSGGMVRLGTGARPSIFAQQQNRLGQGRVIDVIWNKYPRMTELEVRNHLAKLGFRGETVFKPCEALSGGELARLRFAEIVLERPNLLFLDEPTTGVDPVSRKEFWGMLRRLKEQGITIIASTPIIDEARQCDRIAFINEGQIHGIDTPERILNQFASILCPPGLEHGKVEQKDEYVIEVDKLTKRFGNFTAVDHISFKVHRGEIFGFLGANGAGKTTAMRMLTGLSHPTGGTARVAGFDVATRTEDVKKNIGYMSQKFSLYEDLKVWENIRLFAGIYGMAEDEIARKTDELLERIGLSAERDTLVKSLPLGWKQKLAFSVSIFHEPKIVFLDEPTGGVDPATRRQFWELIYQAADRGITVFVTTHFMDEAEYCDRISIMVDGVIRALDTPDELKRQFKVATMDDVFQQLAREAVRTAD